VTTAKRAFVVLEETIDATTILEALPHGVPARVVSLLEAAGGAFAELQSSADIVVVGSARAHEEALRVIEAAARQRPDRPVIALSAGATNGFMERAFEAGADDLITLPLPPDQLRFALEKALARRRSSVSEAAAPLITVLGPKGGTGKTVVATNLAVALAQAGRSTVVVDLDFQFGDVGLALGLPPSRTIYDLATAGSSLDGEKVDGFLVTHPSGAKALLAPVRPDQAATIERSFLTALFELLRARYDYVVVDTPPSFSPEVIAAIDESSTVIVVAMLDALSLKDTKIGLETLDRMGCPSDKITLVLNRADSDTGISETDVVRLFGRRPDVLVPSDRRIPRALTSGTPVVIAEPRSQAAKALTALAARHGATPANDAQAMPAARRRRRFLIRRGATDGAA
jgi:pilus assembly protein CpaE